MVSEMIKKDMAWMEHGLQILLKTYAHSMEDKIAAGAFVCATNYGRDGRFKETLSALNALRT